MDGILRRWSRPAIVVLARSTPEEGVLTPVKTSSSSAGSNTELGARWSNVPFPCCLDCKTHLDT
jgi:hypothetical protein